MGNELDQALDRVRRRVKAMTPEEKARMLREQGESWTRGEKDWPEAEFKVIDGVKVYDSYKDYCNG